MVIFDISVTLNSCSPIDSTKFPSLYIRATFPCAAARVVFSDESGYYELRSEKSSKTNLRKYVIARELIKNN